MVLEAKQLAAEVVIVEQPLADLTRFVLMVLFHRFELEVSPLLQACRHRIAVILAAGLLTSLLIAPAHAQAYPTQYIATNWQTEQGMPQNSVHAIIQDHEGYLWLATAAGIVRFDGVNFKVIGAADIRTLITNRITALHEDRSGDLWVGTQSSGLIRLHDAVPTTYTQRDGLPAAFVNSIREDASGKLWINTSGGIACFAEGKFQAYRTHNGKAVREFFLQARDGSMWFRSGFDVVRFGPDGSIATPTGGFMVHETPDGSVWIAYHDQYRLVRYYRGVFSDVPLPPPVPHQWTGMYPEQGVLAMATDTDGALVLLTPAGFVRAVDGKLSAPEPLRLPFNTAELPKVWNMLVDREGNRWVGTLSTGLFRFRRGPVSAYTEDEGLSDLPFRAVLQDREGRIWLGGDQLYWFDGNRFHLFPGLSDIRAIAQTSDGDLWFGGSGGLHRWRSGVLTRFKIEAPAVVAIRQDRQGTLWILEQTYITAGGLFRFRNGQFEKVASEGQTLLEDRDGGLWLFGPQGIRYLRGQNTVLYDAVHGLPHPAIFSVCQDPTGTLWMSTSGGGLYRFRNGRFTAITTREGLHSDVPGPLAEDGNGSLWFGSNSGIVRVSLKDLNDVADGRLSQLSFVLYGIAEGMRSSECNSWASKARDGRLWFPTMRGVVAVDPNTGNSIPPPVVLEEASANQVRIGRGGHTFIPPGNNTFDFAFTALSLSAPEKQRFRYRLEPYDKEWIDGGTRRTAHYTNMAPGEYSFRVIAANSFGVWNSQGAGVHFGLRPHFYQTNWFYALCAATLLALLWMAHQFRLRHLQRAFNVRLEGRLEERTRIARELHDTLLQSFQGLMFWFQAGRNLLPGRIEEAIRTFDRAIREGDEAIAEGRDAIQGLRADPALESNLEHLLTASGKELARSSGAEGEPPAFRVTVEGARQPLSQLLQDEVYRITREILRNAFRHAHASRIEAEITYDRQFFRLRIRDNGKGIDPKVLEQGARPGHWGLPGVRERAKRIGAQLKLWSEPGAGTEVELTVPARIAYGRAHLREGLRLFSKGKV